MNILLLSGAYNSLTQHAHVALKALQHRVGVAVAVTPEAMAEAVETFQPDLILCPMLTRIIPRSIWQSHRCIILHPGIIGDRGAASLDWAILNEEPTWGTTAVEAAVHVDSGPIWGHERIQDARREQEQPLSRRGDAGGDEGDARCRGAVRERIVRAGSARLLGARCPGAFPADGTQRTPHRLGLPHGGHDSQANPLRRRIAGSPRRNRRLAGLSVRGAPGGNAGRAARRDHRAAPRRHLPRRRRWRGLDIPSQEEGTAGGALQAAGGDGARRSTRERAGGAASFSCDQPQQDLPGDLVRGVGCRRLRPFQLLQRRDGNRSVPAAHGRGAVRAGPADTRHRAFRRTRLLVEWHPSQSDRGGAGPRRGIVAEHPRHERSRALDPERHRQGHHCRDVRQRGRRRMALAADRVFARDGIVLNPHYKGMGGLYGSEYWTYTLPKRVGADLAQKLTDRCQPVSVHEARDIGMIDDVIIQDNYGVNNFRQFEEQIRRIAARFADEELVAGLTRLKREIRAADENRKPLAQYRHEELDEMRRNFWGPDPG